MSVTPSTATAYSTVAETPPGFLLGQQFRDDAAVGASDEQRARGLGRRQVFEQLGALRKRLVLELQEAFDQVFHGVSSQFEQPVPNSLY